MTSYIEVSVGSKTPFFVTQLLSSQQKENKAVCATTELPVSYKLGPRLDVVITRSNFKSEAIFGFLSPNYTGHVT